MGEIKASLAARTVRKEGPVTRRGVVRDFLRALGESWPVAAAPDDPLSGP